MLKSRSKFVSTLVLLTLVGLFFSSTPPAAYAATCTSTGVTTDWNTATTWTGCGVTGLPTATDDVVIAAGHGVTLDIPSATIASLTVNAFLNLNGNTLTVNGNVVNNSTGSPGGIGALNSTLNINGSSCGTPATLTGAGDLFAILTVNVTNVDTSGFTGSKKAVGTVVVNGTGVARTGTTNDIDYNITQCVTPVAAVGGVAEYISPPAQPAQGWLQKFGLIAFGAVLMVGGVGLAVRKW
ncbi:hypothetical protein QUF64_07055 [Anaerolineales bacterium HSG6]|nr:hypothetical protein [Anaerolineales bacterium HSG6]